MKTTNSIDVNGPATIVAVVLLASVTPSVLLFAPAIVGAMVTELGFDLQAAGNLISMELAGMAFATLPGLYWMSRVNWRTAIYVALSILIAGNIASIYMQSFIALAVLRFVVGFCGGSVMLLGMTTIGMTANQERMFSFWVVGQITFGTIGLAVLPHLLPVWGVNTFFAGLALLLTLLMPLARFFPESGATESQIVAETSSNTLLLGAFGLLSIFLFYIAIGGVWSYMERLAAAAEFDAQTIGYTLSVASFFGIVGAFTASGLGDRLGRSIPIVAGMAAVVLSLIMLFGLKSTLIYLVAACLFKWAWTFTLPFLLASITAIDPSGRFIVTTNLVIGAGLAAGPAIAGMTLADGKSFSGLLTLGIVCSMACSLLILPLAKTMRLSPEMSEA